MKKNLLVPIAAAVATVLLVLFAGKPQLSGFSLVVAGILAVLGIFLYVSAPADDDTKPLLSLFVSTDGIVASFVGFALRFIVGWWWLAVGFAAFGSGNFWFGVGQTLVGVLLLTGSFTMLTTVLGALLLPIFFGGLFTTNWLLAVLGIALLIFWFPATRWSLDRALLANLLPTGLLGFK